MTSFLHAYAWSVAVYCKHEKLRSVGLFRLPACKYRIASVAMTVPASLSKMKVFGLSLAMALSLAPVHRPLSVVELWCGVASIAKAAQCAGYANVAMDRDRIPGVTDVGGQSDATEDILTKSGFYESLEGGLRDQQQLLNSANCKRTVARPQGNTAYAPVQEGNRVELMAGFLYAVAMLRGVHPVIEQPEGSIMFRYKPLAKVLTCFHYYAAICARCHFQVDAAMGQRVLKRCKFGGELWVKSLHQKCTCPDGLHKPLVRKGQNGSVSGDTKLLKES